jgi:alcohol dehydrogenase (cytochrome c)
LGATTGKLRCELSTGGGLVFGGSDEGNFFALDAETGKVLWDMQLGGAVRGIPIAYAVDGKEYVAITAGFTLFVFGI